MESNPLYMMHTENDRLQRDCEAIECIALQCRHINVKLCQNENNNMDMEIQRMFEHSSHYTAIIRQKSLWQTWIVVSHIPANTAYLGFICQEVVVDKREEIRREIIAFYNEVDNSAHLLVNKLHAHGLTYMQTMDLSIVPILTSFCTHCDLVVEKIRILHKKLYNLSQYLIVGFAPSEF